MSSVSSESIDKRARVHAALNEAGNWLQGSLDLRLMLQKILATACAALAADKGSILLWDEDSRALNVAVTLGYRDPRVHDPRHAVARGYSAAAAELRRPLLLEDVRTDSSVRYDGDIEEIRAIHSALAVPLIRADEILGVLSLDADRVAAFTAEDLDLLLPFAGQVAAAIHDTRLRARIAASEERYRTLVEQLADAVLVHVGGRVEFASPRAAWVFGAAEASGLVGRSVGELFGSGAAGAQPGAETVADQALGPGGTALDVDVTRLPIRHEGREAVLLLVRDARARRQAEEALRESEKRFAQAFHASPSAISITVFETGLYVDVNDRYLALVGRGREDVVGHSSLDLGVWADPADRVRLTATLKKQRSVRDLPARFRRRTGEERDVVISAEMIQLDGETCILAQSLDVTEHNRAQAERKRAEAETRRTVSILKSTLESTTDGLLVVDLAGRVVTYNRRFVELWRLPPELLVEPDTGVWFQHVRGQLRQAERCLARARELYEQPEAESHEVVEFEDGRVFERCSLPQRLEGRAVGRVWSFRDITERRRNEEHIAHQAFHDALTGLPNRLLLKDRLAQALLHARRQGLHVAVAFLDVDHFKRANDSLGHAFGDRLLQSIAERLTADMRKGDTVARVGGDEFTLLFPDLPSPDAAAHMAEKVLGVFAAPFVLDGHELYVSASLGVALFPGDAEDADDLLARADAALYRAKEAGRNQYQLCTPGMGLRARERMLIESRLRHALGRGELFLEYQPLVDVTTRRIVGTEALLRWRHPELGLVPPQTFIPVAEDSRLIVDIGEWVLRRACHQLAEWHRAGFTALRMSVNLSARQLQHDGLLRTVEAALADAGLPARFLELEITESIAVQVAEWSANLLCRLHELGVRIAIDDFGAGQSSLSYLRRFPVGSLKIDRSFLSEIADGPPHEPLVKAVCALAQVLGLNVIAEGVETEAQMSFLAGVACQEAQGFLLSAPLAPEALRARLGG